MKIPSLPSGEVVSHVLTRMCLALVYLSFGYVQLANPTGWVSYLPEFLTTTPLRPELFIFLNGTGEIVLGLFLLLGLYIRPVAVLLGLHLLGITASVGFNAVGIRDFGLSLATLGVAFAGNDHFSLGGSVRRRNLLARTSTAAAFYLFVALLAFGALAFSVRTYEGPYLEFRESGASASTPTPEGSGHDPSSGSASVLDADAVARHASADDCWIIVSGNVYAVGEYVPFHPGGAKRITDLCGKDATTAFATKGGTGGEHSSRAKELLATYLVGAVGEIVPGTSAQSATSSPTQSVPTATPSFTPTPTPTATVTPTPAPVSALTAASVATHNRSSDCWVIISGNVYNVTAYIPFHPGGTSRITNVCGQDATTAFNTRGGTGSHSSYARGLLANYLIGALGSAVTPTPTPSGTPTPTPTPTPTATVTPTPAPAGGLTAGNIATHNSASSCWLIINGNVYDVTAYIPFHPGGTSRIVNQCGREASTAFNTRGGSGSHSSNARSLLAGYLLGPLVTGSPTPTPSPGSTVTPTPTPTASPGDPYTDAVTAQYPGAVITQLSLEDDGRAEVTFTWNGNGYHGTISASYVLSVEQ